MGLFQLSWRNAHGAHTNLAQSFRCSRICGWIIAYPGPLFQFLDGADGSTLKGFMFTNAKWYALMITAGADSTTVQGNYINTDGISQVGTYLYPTGVQVIRADHTTIGGPAAGDRNLISGNTGIQLDGSSYTTIEGNYCGLQADGITPISGQVVNSACVFMESVTYDLTTYIPTGNVVRGNVMAGFAYGIELNEQVNNTLIVGNKIGVAADGSTNRGMGSGIALFGAHSNTIGGADAADRNIVSGNTYAQIRIHNTASFQSDSNLIQGNYIGTDASGETALAANNAQGILIEGGNGNQIGGANPGEGNVVSGFPVSSAIQVNLDTGPLTNTSILGNRIGTDKHGQTAIPNYVGVDINNNVVAVGNGTSSGQNLIAASVNSGVRVTGAASAGTTIQGNKIGVNRSGSSLPNNTNGILLNTNGSAQIRGNWIANSGANSLRITSSGVVEAGSFDNCFINNGTNGLKNENTVVLPPLENNWWGDPSGPTEPTGNPAGTGDKITTSIASVDYTPFLTTRPSVCAPELQADSLSLNFGNTIYGFSTTRLLTLNNVGQAQLNISSISTATPFSVDPSSTCPAAGGTLAAGASCTVRVRFTPTAPGGIGGSLTIVSDDATSPHIISLAGLGITGTELLKNRSFESDSNLDKKPDSWSYSNFNPVTDKRDCTVRKVGSCSLKLVGNGQTKVVRQTILQNGVAGDNFAFSLWSKSNAVPSGSVYRLQVQFFDGATLVSTRTMNFATGTHAFQRVSGVFTATTSYTKIVYKIIFKAASGTAWFDPATLKWAP